MRISPILSISFKKVGAVYEKTCKTGLCGWTKIGKMGMHLEYSYRLINDQWSRIWYAWAGHVPYLPIYSGIPISTISIEYKLLVDSAGISKIIRVKRMKWILISKRSLKYAQHTSTSEATTLTEFQRIGWVDQLI